MTVSAYILIETEMGRAGDVARAILRLVGGSESLIRPVPDRPGPDRRYALDSSRARRELGWSPEVPFERGLEETVAWYLGNEGWWRPIREGRYKGERLGLNG